MDDIIIKKGTDVVLNRDLNVREVTVARKGLKVACEKDIKKGDTEVTLSYEGRMEFDVPVEYVSKSDNTLFENKESKSAKNDIICQALNGIHERGKNRLRYRSFSSCTMCMELYSYAVV